MQITQGSTQASTQHSMQVSRLSKEEVEPLLLREQFAVSLRKKKKQEILRVKREKLSLSLQSKHRVSDPDPESQMSDLRTVLQQLDTLLKTDSNMELSINSALWRLVNSLFTCISRNDEETVGLILDYRSVIRKLTMPISHIVPDH